MKIEFGPEFEESMRKLIWRERLKYINPAEWYRQIRWFIQRGVRGYSDQDSWNAYCSIAKVTKGFIAHERQHQMHHPIGVSMKKWGHILDEIDWLMDEVLEMRGEPEVWASDNYQERRKQAEKLFGKYWQHFWC